ncbi:unnamed protein product [Caenorhabditis auriculariae]|uniref:Nematode cuticle collagen N-terminal domain-containing protein n=1 Tax=Caenorhabditis auriculariae TaxID=2777116 RepID=A0A8S1HWE7_9PELO|nr:unnamed protein product [Caenorhabditis auriculariae]
MSSSSTLLTVASVASVFVVFGCIFSVGLILHDINTFYDEKMQEIDQFKEIEQHAWESMISVPRGSDEVRTLFIGRNKRQAQCNCGEDIPEAPASLDNRVNLVILATLTTSTTSSAAEMDAFLVQQDQEDQQVRLETPVRLDPTVSLEPLLTAVDKDPQDLPVPVEMLVSQEDQDELDNLEDLEDQVRGRDLDRELQDLLDDQEHQVSQDSLAEAVVSETLVLLDVPVRMEGQAVLEIQEGLVSQERRDFLAVMQPTVLAPPETADLISATEIITYSFWLSALNEPNPSPTFSKDILAILKSKRLENERFVVFYEKK